MTTEQESARQTIDSINRRIEALREIADKLEQTFFPPILHANGNSNGRTVKPAQPAKKPRAMVAAAGSPIELMTKAMLSMDGNFTSVDFRERMRSLKPGAGKADFQNTSTFLKRRVNEGKLTVVDHGGENFYKLVKVAEVASA